MSPAVVMWIKDGVLLNRMPVNAVSFACCYWIYTPPGKRRGISIEALINFGFSKSGISCAEKMRLFNAQCGNALNDVEDAARFYNILATQAAKSCNYFAGAVQLLEDLKENAVVNFISSAVEQNVLDDWAASPQGMLSAPYLTEILGKRTDFCKGPDHFKHAAINSQGGPVYYVADAVSEISTARDCSPEINLRTVGFGYEVSREQVMEAVVLVQRALSTGLESKVPYPGLEGGIDPDLLLLPCAVELEEKLRSAGAGHVATGAADQIMGNLRHYFVKSKLLPQPSAQS